MSKLKTVYKYISFIEIEQKPKTKVYSCINNKSEIELDIVKWFPSWRQYCFYSIMGAIFSNGCLHDVQDFMDQLNASHKKTI